MTNKFSITCMMPSICGSAVGKLLHANVLAPRILRKILGLKRLCTPALIITIFLRILCDDFIVAYLRGNLRVFNLPLALVS